MLLSVKTFRSLVSQKSNYKSSRRLQRLHIHICLMHLPTSIFYTGYLKHSKDKAFLKCNYRTIHICLYFKGINLTVSRAEISNLTKLSCILLLRLLWPQLLLQSFALQLRWSEHKLQNSPIFFFLVLHIRS